MNNKKYPARRRQSNPSSSYTHGPESTNNVNTLSSTDMFGGNGTSRDMDTRKKMKMEAHLTAGCGIGKKKTEMIDAFWKIVWPQLEKECGWKKLEGSGKQDGYIYFIPMDVDLQTGKNGEDYYVRIKAVIDRVLERRNDAESKIADQYLEELRRLDRLSSRRRRDRHRHTIVASSSSGSSSSRAQKVANQSQFSLDLSWKNSGKYFPRKTRVGSKFQATNIPKANFYKHDVEDNDNYNESCYEQIWDPKRAEDNDVLDIIEKTIPYNRKEKALVALHELEYNECKFKEAVSRENSEILPMDGSDWSIEEKKQFHDEIFRLRGDITAVSKSIGKSMNTCLAYYIGKYKQSCDSLLLKAVCNEEQKAALQRRDHDLDACAICGEGGSLLICDGCEGEYHMACLQPPLACVPEGKWECDECVDRKFLEARDFLIQNSGLFEKVGRKDSNRAKRKRDGAHSSTDSNNANASADNSNRDYSSDDNPESTNVFRPTAHAIKAVKALAKGLSDVFSSDAMEVIDEDI